MHESKHPNDSHQIIFDVLQKAQQQLNPYSETARLDAELLLSHVLKKSRALILANPNNLIKEAELEIFNTLIKKRIQKIPMAYILGTKEFWSLDFFVNTDVLIPRPETELLVEKILNDHPKHSERTLIDLGTGSGAIAISLAKERPHWKIFATDVSSKALTIAQVNAKQHGVLIDFMLSDWFHGVLDKLRFDIVVSNPPYLSEEDPHLHNTEIAHEPKIALTAPDKGLKHYQTLAKQSRFFLNPSGKIYLEHGIYQEELITEMLKKSGCQTIEHHQDLANIKRVIVGSFY